MLVHIAHDKKIADGKVNAVIIRGLGKCEVMPMTLKELEDFVS